MTREACHTNTQNGKYLNESSTGAGEAVMNRMLQLPTAGKLRTLRSPHESWRSWTVAPLLAFFAIFAFSSAPALAAEGGACSNETIRSEQGTTNLPDCRAYEMVTPPYKEGYQLLMPSLAANGDRMLLTGPGTLDGVAGEGEGAENYSVYLDTRGVGGWQLTPLNAPLSSFVGQLAVAYDAANGETLWDQHTPRQSAKTRGLYIRSADGEYSFVGPMNPAAGEEEESGVIEPGENDITGPEAGTEGYGHVVLYAIRPEDHWSFDETEGLHSLYEYSGLNNTQPILVAVTGVKGSRKLVSRCESLFGGGEEGSTYNALSSDGETIFFSLRCSPAEEELYARVHGSLVSGAPAETVDVSESECSSACGGVSGKNFEGASEAGADGSVVFFTSTQKLTDDAVDETATGDAAKEEGCAAGGVECNLYEYDFTKPKHEELSLVAGGVQGVAAVSGEGSHVYFVSTARLTEEPRGGSAGSCLAELTKAELEAEEASKEGRCRPKHEADNLYVYDTASGATKFITTLGAGDLQDWQRESRRPVEVAGEGSEAGAFLLFASSTKGLTAGDESPEGITQLFEYDAVTGELVRVTQGENGYDDNGNSVKHGVPALDIADLADDDVGSVENNFRDKSDIGNLSRDGRTVVFVTAGGLSAHAPSSLADCTSVYEFRSVGPILGGRVSLVSDGRDVEADKGSLCGAEFFGMDASGANILFSTADPLLSSDVDGVQRDIYDAREDGGFPPGPVSTPECQGTGCQGTFSSTPGSVSPGSLNQAPEAPVPPLPPLAAETGTKTGTKKTTSKCAKGKKLSHGKCVKVKTKQKAKRAKKASFGRRVK
jgi:hypothetical protein